MQRQDRKGCRYGFLCRETGPYQLNEIGHGTVMIITVHQPNRPCDPASD